MMLEMIKSLLVERYLQHTHSSETCTGCRHWELQWSFLGLSGKGNQTLLVHLSTSVHCRHCSITDTSTKWRHNSKECEHRCILRIQNKSHLNKQTNKQPQTKKQSRINETKSAILIRSLSFSVWNPLYTYKSQVKESIFLFRFLGGFHLQIINKAWSVSVYVWQIICN